MKVSLDKNRQWGMHGSVTDDAVIYVANLFGAIHATS